MQEPVENLRRVTLRFKRDDQVAEGEGLFTVAELFDFCNTLRGTDVPLGTPVVRYTAANAFRGGLLVEWDFE